MKNEIEQRQKVIELLYIRKSLIDAYNSVCAHCVDQKDKKKY